MAAVDESGLLSPSSNFYSGLTGDLAGASRKTVESTAADCAANDAESLQGQSLLFQFQREDAEFQQHRLEAVVAKQASQAQLQLNTMSQEIGNLARELAAARQDINTLRVADTHFEVHNAEVSRHSREMQGQLRSDMKEQMVLFQDLRAQVEVAVAGAVSQASSAVQLVQGLEDRVVHDRAIVEDRLSAISTVCEENFASIQLIQTDVSGHRNYFEKEILAFQAKLASEVRSLKSEHDTRVTAMQTSFQMALSDLERNLGGELERLKSQHAAATVRIESLIDSLDTNSKIALRSLDADLRGLVRQLSEESSTRILDLEELITKVDAQGNAARQELQTSLTNDLQDNVSSLARLRRDVQEHKTSADEACTDIRRNIEQERGVREKAHGSLTEQLSSLNGRTNDRLEQMSKEHAARHADLRDLVSNTAAQEKAAREELAFNSKELISNLSSQERAAREEFALRTKADVQDMQSNFSTTLAEHKASTDDSHTRLRTLIATEQASREKMLDSIGERHEDMERRLKDHVVRLGQEQSAKHGELKEVIAQVSAQAQTARDDMASTSKADLMSYGENVDLAHQTHCQKLEALERRLTKEVSQLSEEHDAKHDQMRSSHANLEVMLANLEQQTSADQKAMTEDHRRAVDEILSKHMDLGDMIHRFNNEHHVKHGEVHERALDHVQGLDKRMREGLTQHTSESEAKLTEIAGSCAALERKLREDLDASMTEQNSRHSETRELLTKFTQEQYRELAEMREHFSRTTSQKNGMAEENARTVALQELENKLRREISARGDQNYDAVYEYLNKERQDREVSNAALLTSVDDLDRRMKDLVLQARQAQDERDSSLNSMLSSFESKLRDEIMIVQDSTQARTSELKDQLQKGLNEQVSSYMEVKELVARSEEKRSRDDTRQSVSMSLEALEGKLRRELASAADRLEVDFGNTLVQERKQRERAQSGLMDRLDDVERRTTEQMSQVSTRDMMQSEMREIATNAISRERMQTQSVLAVEQESLATQLESFNKLLLQEKALRESQQENLSVYLTNDKIARDLSIQNMVTKDEHDAYIQNFQQQTFDATDQSMQRIQQEANERLERELQAIRNSLKSEMHGLQKALQQALGNDMQAVQRSLLKALQNSVTIEATGRIQSSPTKVLSEVSYEAPFTRAARSVSPMPANCRASPPGRTFFSSAGNSVSLANGIAASPGKTVFQSVRQVVQSHSSASAPAASTMTTVGVDTTNDGVANYVVASPEVSREGIPDAWADAFQVRQRTQAQSSLSAPAGVDTQFSLSAPTGIDNTCFVIDPDLVRDGLPKLTGTVTPIRGNSLALEPNPTTPIVAAGGVAAKSPQDAFRFAAASRVGGIEPL